MIDVPPSAHGICSLIPLQAVNWSVVSGASLAPKSTVRAVIAATPPPEPMALYWSSMPYAAPRGETHCATSGATKVLPAPAMVVVCRAAFAFAVPATTTARAAAAATTLAMRNRSAEFRHEIPPRGFAANVRPGRRRVGHGAVSAWLRSGVVHSKPTPIQVYGVAVAIDEALDRIEAQLQEEGQRVLSAIRGAVRALQEGDV